MKITIEVEESEKPRLIALLIGGAASPQSRVSEKPTPSSPGLVKVAPVFEILPAKSA